MAASRIMKEVEHTHTHTNKTDGKHWGVGEIKMKSMKSKTNGIKEKS